MRNLLICAAPLLGPGTPMGQMAEKMTATRPASAMASSQNMASAAPDTAGSRSLSIPRDARGHFQTDGRIDGQRIDFMVDTGASVIALNEKSAARFGLRPTPADYKMT